jgi:probable F420-dependent oxidoreductase
VVVEDPNCTLRWTPRPRWYRAAARFAQRLLAYPSGSTVHHMGMEQLGVTFASLPALGVAGALGVGKRAESLGYHSFWVAETVGTEAFSLLAAVSSVAPTLGLGTGVLAMQLRSPALAAMGAATLQALSPDQDIFLGVGISSPVVTSQWHGAPYGDRPIARMREYLTLLRECLSGEPVTFQGDFWSVKKFRLGIRPGERKPKIILGALGPQMLRLGGELADGVLLNYLPATHVPWSIEQVRRGGNATIYAYVHAGVVSDRNDGIDLARRDLFSYAVVDGYARNFTLAGFGDEVEACRAAHAAGDRAGALAAISDPMVDAIDFMGDHHDVHRFVRSYVEAGVEVPVLMPLPWGPDRMAVTVATLTAAV